jgi:hypothetical protein
MFNTCYRCGSYRADKLIEIEHSGKGIAICPECGQRHPFLPQTLLVVSGASGAGKSTAAQLLLGKLKQAVLLDVDILWRPEFDTPETGYRDFFETWLRMAKNIGQSGRPVVLFGAGVGVPANFAPCVERRYFAAVHYLALVCDDARLAERLRQRPAWRLSADDAFIEGQLSFNRWFQTQARDVEPAMELVDTTDTSPDETARQVAQWIARTLGG